MPPDRPDSFQEQDGARRRHVPAAALALLQEDANRARLRRQAKRAGLHGLFGQADRRIAQEFDLFDTHHALGIRRYVGPKMRRVHPVGGLGATYPLLLLRRRARTNPGPSPGFWVTASYQMHEFLRRRHASAVAILLRHGATNPRGPERAIAVDSQLGKGVWSG